VLKPKPEFVDLKITLQVRVSVGLKPGVTVTPEEVREQLERTLQDCSDGRYPFPVEQLQAGLRASVTYAVSEAVERRTYARYRGLQIGEHYASTWLSERKLEGLCVYPHGSLEVPAVELDKEDK
jgi:hypothetical protein